MGFDYYERGQLLISALSLQTVVYSEYTELAFPTYSGTVSLFCSTTFGGKTASIIEIKKKSVKMRLIPSKNFLK